MELDQELVQTLAKLPLQDFANVLASATNDNEHDELVIHRCATDLEFYSWYFFSHYCSREFNEFHEEMFGSFRFGERDVRRVRAAPRGSAKSTLATLIKPLHDVCYGLEQFILILSSTTPLANKKLKDIRNEVQTNSLLVAVYGVRFPKKKVGESEFCVFSNFGKCNFVAVGKGSEVRGIRVNETGPLKSYPMTLSTVRKSITKQFVIKLRRGILKTLQRLATQEQTLNSSERSYIRTLSSRNF
jgi:hypothetical protein